MRQSIIPLFITGVLAVGAGVAIAGLPSTTPGDDLIITEVPTTTTTTIPFVADVVAPLPTTTTTSTTVLETTSASTGRNLSPTTLPPSSQSLVERAELGVVTANGADVPGIAGGAAEALLALGYTTVEAVDAPAIVEDSVVFHPDDLAAEAIRLAADLGWSNDQVAPIDFAPQLTTTVTADLIVLIGLDEVAAPDAP